MNEHKLLTQFAENIKMEFAVKELTVYKNYEKIYGGSLDSAAIDKYLALPCTTVYKCVGSKLVTRFNLDNNLYIMVLSSDGDTAFDGLEAEYIISDIKKLIGKLGD